MELSKGQEISVLLRGNNKPILATFLGWMPNLETTDQVFLVVECKGEERRIHDMFIGEINGIAFTA
jgi:hypothetical protein